LPPYVLRHSERSEEFWYLKKEILHFVQNDTINKSDTGNDFEIASVLLNFDPELRPWDFFL